MRSIVVLLPLALAGCPPPTQYLIADVTTARAPVADALVTADCGPYGGAALRTDETGRARVTIRHSAHAERCVVTVAKPGYSTVESDGISLCTSTTCPPTAIDLLPSHAPYAPRDPYPMAPPTPYDDGPLAPPVDGRDYATPPPPTPIKMVPR